MCKNDPVGGVIDKDRLKKYVYMKTELDNQYERLERMRANEELPAMRESDGSSHSRTVVDRMATAVVRRLEFQEKLKKQVAEVEAEMTYIEDSIDAMDNPMEKEVLRLRYIDGEYCRLMDWKSVSKAIYGDDDDKHLLATYRLHGHALQSIEKLTGGAEVEPKER